jgi:hypothetical protein
MCAGVFEEIPREPPAAEAAQEEDAQEQPPTPPEYKLFPTPAIVLTLKKPLGNQGTSAEEAVGGSEGNALQSEGGDAQGLATKVRCVYVCYIYVCMYACFMER